MVFVSAPRFLVAHGLRLKGFADLAVVASFSGLDEFTTHAHLEAMAADGHARLREGRISGWSLTPDGRKLHDGACADEITGAGCVAVVEEAYREFLECNGAFLAACTDWQVRADAPSGAGAQVLNAHDDAAYDAAVVARLGAIDDAIQPILGDLAGHLARFGQYAPRLANARARVESGERDWFTGAMIDSYHAVWFELHEDFLVTLGIRRSTEPSAGKTAVPDQGKTGSAT